jgi:hypothetical protein
LPFHNENSERRAPSFKPIPRNPGIFAISKFSLYLALAEYLRRCYPLASPTPTLITPPLGFSDGSIVEKLDASTAELGKFKAIPGAPEAFEF